MISSYLSNRWDSFFHDRTGIQGCKVAGYMRVGFALCFLIDRIVMLFFLDFYFSPTNGVMPFRVTRHNWELVGWHQKSLFMLFPESEAFLWIFSTTGIVQGAILLLGATNHLRLHMFGLWLNILSFRNHNILYWDGEDDLFKIWAFLLLFFPLDHCTMHDGFGFKGLPSSASSSSWPMWPFRIFQIEVVLIYMGASLAKIVVKDWQDGSALFRISYGIQDFPGIFNPDCLFGRYGPLKILTWSSVLVEGLCYITVWIPALRNISIGLMMLFHVGIDMSMNMHMFEWLACIGWCVFWIQPERISHGNETNVVESKRTPKKKVKRKKTPIGSRFRKSLTNLFVTSFLFVISMDCIPFTAIGKCVPHHLKPAWEKIVAGRNYIFNGYIDYIITPMGLAQGGDWGMYTDVEQVVVFLRLDAELTNGTIVKNVWRSPDWFALTDWERKFYCRDANYYDILPDLRDELLYFVEVISKSFVVENDVKGLIVTKETRAHYNLKMESSGGFWSPVLRPPMDAYFEEIALKVRLGDCVDELSSGVCAQLIKENGCHSLVEQCRKSCSKDCSRYSSFVVDHWLDPNSFDFEDEDGEDDHQDDGYLSTTDEL